MMSQSIATGGLGVSGAGTSIPTWGIIVIPLAIEIVTEDRRSGRTIHIQDILPGDVLRVALRPGYHLNPDHMRNMAPPRKPRAAKNSSRTTVLVYVITNSPSTGTIVASMQGWRHQGYFTATIPYKAIKYAQRQITPRDPVTLPVGNPGVVAFGAPYGRELWKYQRVVF